MILNVQILLQRLVKHLSIFKLPVQVIHLLKFCIYSGHVIKESEGTIVILIVDDVFLMFFFYVLVKDDIYDLRWFEASLDLQFATLLAVGGELMLVDQILWKYEARRFLYTRL